jgi:5-methylcytosine-specific restriction protein B
MNQEEINSGIELLCETSAEVKSYYSNDQNIVEALNNAKKEDLQKCMDYYKSKSGVVIDPRKEIIEKLLNKEKFTVESLHELINGYKEGKENQFRSYKETFSIVFPAITFYGHNSQRDFVKTFTEKLISDLEISNEVKEVSFDFQGVRQQGSERYWVAIYNKHQENQSIGVQFFIEFFEGKIGYGVYKHENQTYLKPRVSLSPEDFDYNDMLSYFQESKQTLLDDIPKYENLHTIPLLNHKLFKISHGSFKAKKDSPIIDTFKSNNWIVLHENTRKGQADSFKNDLKVGDYVYITIGSRELVGIAKLTSDKWEYVPNDIVDDDGWLYREVEMIQPAIRKNPKELKTHQKIFYPSANSTFSEISHDNLLEANNLLFKPYFNAEFTLETTNKYTVEEMDSESNQILFGPPGTGKTYNTINKALQLLGDEISDLKRKDVKALFKRRLEEGRIVFTTFHQSMTYEDFIEGIKPETKDELISYTIEDGIFKQLCYKAIFAHFSSNNDIVTEFNAFDDLYDRYIESIEGRLEKLKDDEKLLLPLKSSGYFTEIKSINEDENYLLTRGIRANSDAKVFKERLRLLYNKFKSIDDIKDVSADIRSVGKGLGWSSNYYGVFKDFKAFEKASSTNKSLNRTASISYNDYDKIKNFISNSSLPEKFLENADKFVLIIDEINRGSVSQIFGELITLLESDKRLGKPEELTLTLPYSKTSFGVPPNLFVLGTMNTADRSVEALDTALRRRFSFIEMPPKPKLIQTEGELENGLINGINLSSLLATINKRIEKLLDKDHMIGHSYFLSVKNLKDLKTAFQNKIIPLLQEYFFGDYGKIGLVIGSDFFDIIDNQVDEDFFAAFEDYDSSPMLERKVYHLKNVQKMIDKEFIEALNSLERKK